MKGDKIKKNPKYEITSRVKVMFFISIKNQHIEWYDSWKTATAKEISDCPFIFEKANRTTLRYHVSYSNKQNKRLFDVPIIKKQYVFQARINSFPKL